jgi:RimJ/RimL family protein N-acetyltransferase
MSLSLETPRLLLRPFRPDDLETFLAYRSDPQIAEYQGWQMPYTRAMAEEFLTEMQDRRPNLPGEWYQMVIQVKSSGEMAGDIAYYLLKNDTRQAEIGLTLAQEYHRLGYATEAAECLLEHLFGELSLHRVRANCDVLNTPAWKTLERLGFRREAHYVENLWFRERWSSEYWYGMLDREWRTRQSGV